MKRQAWMSLPTVLAAWSLGGCREEAPRAYSAPADPALSVDAAAPAAGGDEMGGVSRPAPASAPRNARPPWTVPKGWDEKPDPAGVRQASYAVTRGGRSLDIAVTAFPGNTGSELDNVNRWRRELGLAEVTAEALKGLAKPVKIGTEDGRLYEFVAEAPRPDGKPAERTLVAQLSVSELNVFFKLRGDAALAEEERANFHAWIASVETGPRPPETAAAPAAPSGPAPADMRGPVASPPRTDLPKWSPPAHWQSAGEKPMRLASFDIPGDGGAKGDLSISALGGAAGGLLANVNRWRGQVGLAPWSDEQLAKESEVLKFGADSGTLVDLKGADKRILAVIMPRGERTWFYKLTAPDALVTREREAFVSFVKSVRY